MQHECAIVTLNMQNSQRTDYAVQHIPSAKEEIHVLALWRIH
jgi:hypothetical protein